jgi:hypothetical protein
MAGGAETPNIAALPAIALIHTWQLGRSRGLEIGLRDATQLIPANVGQLGRVLINFNHVCFAPKATENRAVINCK